MSVRLQWTGLTEALQALTRAPAEVRAEGMAIVRETTEAASREMAQTYPEVTGTLRRRVSTYYPSSRVLVGIAQSRAPHVHWYEKGTKDRRTDKTSAFRGRMAARPVTPAIAVRHRRQMFGRLVALLRNRGYQVDGV